MAATYQGSPRKERSVISRATTNRSRWYPPPFYRGEKREVLLIDSYIKIPKFNGLLSNLIVCNEDRKKSRRNYFEFVFFSVDNHGRNLLI